MARPSAANAMRQSLVVVWPAAAPAECRDLLDRGARGAAGHLHRHAAGRVGERDARDGARPGLDVVYIEAICRAIAEQLRAIWAAGCPRPATIGCEVLA